METVAWCCGKERYIDSKKMKLRKKSIVLSESESESESESLSLSRFLSLSLSLSCQEAGVKGPRGQRVRSTRQVATACLPAVLLPLPSSSTPVRTNIHLCVSAYPRRSRYKHKKASTRPADSHNPHNTYNIYYLSGLYGPHQHLIFCIRLLCAMCTITK
jgi:hypothetical protein